MSKQGEKPEWVRVAEEYEESGLTQREFAERRGMTLSTRGVRGATGGRAGAQVVLTLPGSVRILLATQPVDMRNSIDGLMALVRTAWGEDVYSGHLFVFVSRKGDRGQPPRQRGIPLTVIKKELMGHATIDMTERYAHLSPDTRREAVGVPRPALCARVRHTCNTDGGSCQPPVSTA